MNPVIHATNLLPLGTLSASSTASGYDVANLGDVLEFTHWKAGVSGTAWIMLDLGVGASGTASALGIKRHNLKTVGAAINVESSNDAITWTPRLLEFTPASDKAFLKTFTAATARYWRINLASCTAAPQMAVCVLGPRIDFPLPPESPFAPAEEGIEGDVNRSKLGVLLGVTVRWRTFRVRARWTRIERNWLESNMQAWWDNHASNLKPFFWAWDLSNYPNLVLYGTVPDGYTWRPDVSILGYYESFNLEIEGAKE